jgi:hypothetical protein
MIHVLFCYEFWYGAVVKTLRLPTTTTEVSGSNLVYDMFIFSVEVYIFLTFFWIKRTFSFDTQYAIEKKQHHQTSLELLLY